MKKQLLILLLILCFNGVRAQSAYIPFPSNMVIYALTQTAYYASPPSIWATHRTEITGDTLIGGYNYKKLYSGVGPFTVTAAIRNDTLGKKVYMYSVATGTEKLLYDFNLSVGDTVNRNDGYGFYEPLVADAVSGSSFVKIDTAWVTSIDSVFMPYDGLYHKRFNFSGTVKNINTDSADVEVSSSYPGPYYGAAGGYELEITMNQLIEGVGQIYNPISHYYFFEYEWGYQNNCVSINGNPIITLYPWPPPFVDPDLCNSIYTGMDEIKKAENFVLYPSPTNGLLQIKTEQEITSIEVLDIFGRRMLYTENNQTEINISDFENGIYFIRLSDSKGNSLVKKVVKQ